MKKISIAVLASGRGSNFNAIIENIKKGKCNAQINVLITNKIDAPAVEIAKKNFIPVEFLDKKKFKSREEMDDHLFELLKKYSVELVVLAGYMLLIKSKKLLEFYKNRIINIHPSLLPSFAGETAQKDAFDYGCKISGLTIHFVDEGLDSGPIIYQEAVDISNCSDEFVVSQKILESEHQAYSYIIDLFSKGTFSVSGRKVTYKKY